MTSQPYSYEPNEFVASYKDAMLKMAGDSLPSLPVDEISRGSKLKVAAVQLETPVCSAGDFLDRAEQAVVKAVFEHGANLVLLQELFLGPYFCQSQEAACFGLAESDIDGNNPFILRMQGLAKLLSVVLPISIFERKNNAFYNSVVMIDADGTNLGTYRE